MNSTQVKALSQHLLKPQKVAIVSHRNPDGDAYGSSLALYHYLVTLGHEVDIVSPNDCPQFLKWLPGQDQITVFELEEEKATTILNSAETVFTLDFNALHRVGDSMQKVLEEIKPVYVMVDHHQQPDAYAQFTFSDDKISSTCELLFNLMEELELPVEINQSIATCLYTGILTDTGSFRFPATTSNTHRIVAKLLDAGAEHSAIYNAIHNVNTYNRMQLLGRALRNMKVCEAYRTAYITLSKHELRKFNFQKGDTEGFVNYALSLENVVFAAIFIEDKKQGIIKISLRSVGNFSVNEFSRNHFNGGGHINAAGGRSELDLNQTVNQFLELLPKYQKELTASDEN